MGKYKPGRSMPLKVDARKVAMEGGKKASANEASVYLQALKRNDFNDEKCTSELKALNCAEAAKAASQKHGVPSINYHLQRLWQSLRRHGRFLR